MVLVLRHQRRDAAIGLSSIISVRSSNDQVVVGTASQYSPYSIAQSSDLHGLCCQADHESFPLSVTHEALEVEAKKTSPHGLTMSAVLMLFCIVV